MEIEYGPEQVRRLLAEAARRRPAAGREVDAAALLGPEGLTRRSSTFARREVLRALAEDAAEGASLNVLQQRKPSRSSPDPKSSGWMMTSTRYTTREMLAVEQHVMDLAEAGRGAGLRIVPGRQVDAALAAVPLELGEDQAAMVRGLLTSRRGVEVVRAAAGTGPHPTVRDPRRRPAGGGGSRT